MPTMYNYEARVRPGGKGSLIPVTIQAADTSGAKRLLESQYGKGNVSMVIRKGKV